MEPLKNMDNGNITVYNSLDSLKEIEEKIFCIRGAQVMIDKDLAEIYKVETRIINQAVKRNIERFPERYMFQLTKEEQQFYYSLRSQFVTLDTLKSQIVISKKGGNRYLPFAFTEQGVSMLASVLKSETAVQTSIKIIDAFVAMRHFMQKNAKLDKFNTQYPTITLNYTETFHDRFLILDNATAYSIGSSVKDAGKRCFAVTQINEEWMVKMILERL